MSKTKESGIERFREREARKDAARQQAGKLLSSIERAADCLESIHEKRAFLQALKVGIATLYEPHRHASRQMMGMKPIPEIRSSAMVLVAVEQTWHVVHGKHRFTLGIFANQDAAIAAAQSKWQSMTREERKRFLAAKPEFVLT